MKRYQCTVCQWIYNEEEGYPEGGIKPRSKFDDFLDDWSCPFCSSGKDLFVLLSMVDEG